MREIFKLSSVFIVGAVIAAFTAPEFAYGHGEDKAGPHGGLISMPGPFHTELSLSDSELHIYLLDLDWKNPVTKNSSVHASIKVNSVDQKLSCHPVGLMFQCALPRGIKMNKGELKIKANRSGTPGVEVSYKLPLKIPAGNTEKHH